MPALLVDTRPASSGDAGNAAWRDSRPVPVLSSDASATSSGIRSQSPDRPPVSPLTPTSSAAQLASPVERTQQPRPAPPPPPTATFIPRPPPVAISESENTDAIALRSAISILQLQREKSKRDLRALEELKAAAVSNPQAFVRSIQEQRAQASRSSQDILTPTLAGLIDGDSSDDDNARNTDARKDSTHSQATGGAPKFPPIPQPQNIVRCPPINWEKYHIVGEPLDKMHEEQKKWPGSAEPPRTKSGQRAPPHCVAAPYSPFTDEISSSRSSSTPQPQKNSKKPS